CTDNAAMIAFAGLQRKADASTPLRVMARSRIGPERSRP
ncbi:MAG: tRNA (adenosine(37)-N6)-threonylcarbamoyltransferase complex transferase subunit TsaD, partial [Thermoanaerobaculia bacterium]